MTNKPYDLARNWMSNAGLNWTTLDLAIVAWSGPPTFVATDTTIQTIITRGTTTKRGISMVNPTKTVAADGTVQTTPMVIPALPVGAPITHFTMVKRSTTENNSQPIFYIDVAENLPFTPNGLDQVVQPDWLQQRGWFRP